MRQSLRGQPARRVQLTAAAVSQDEGGDAVDWTKEGAGQTYDPTDAGDFDLSEDS